MRLLLSLLMAVVCAGMGVQAHAHALPGTAVALDFRQHDVGVNLEIPLDQLELGYKHALMNGNRTTVGQQKAQLAAYFLRHIEAIAPDGRRWAVRVLDMRATLPTDVAPLEVNANLVMTPPPGAPLRKFRFNYSIINHEVMTHTVMVFARNDWDNGVLAPNPELLGTIRWLVTGLDIDRNAGDFWNGMKGVVRLGVDHIAEGTDHLLFLFALLLPAPLLRSAGGRRWGDYGGGRYALGRLVRIVTAFTIGHSLTLIVGGFANVVIPSKPVEVAIAFSIFVSALHAWRPLLHKREAWVAAGFGLIHGMAFSQIVAGAGMDGWHKAAAVFGFNVGIELCQLAILAIVMPWLILLARTRHYAPVRVFGAGFAAVASLGWMLERVTGLPNPISTAVSATFEWWPGLLLMLVLGALFATVARSRGGPSPAVC